jgi:toxin ParE1/3/4
MTNKPVEFHDKATEEFEASLDWYFQRSPLAASKFAEELNRALDQISSNPNRWPIHRIGTRKFLLHQFPFILIYRELPSVIQILAVSHGHRRPGYWKQRM